MAEESVERGRDEERSSEINIRMYIPTHLSKDKIWRCVMSSSESRSANVSPIITDDAHFSPD